MKKIFISLVVAVLFIACGDSKDDKKVLESVKKEERRYRDWETDRKSTRLNSSHRSLSRMPSSA